MRRLLAQSWLQYVLVAAGVVGAFAPQSGRAAEILVADANGLIFHGDSTTGSFQFFGVCGGPVSSMALLNGELFLGSPAGRVYRVDVETRFVTGFFDVSNNAAAMAVHGGRLLIGGSNSTVLRVDPASGATLETLHTPDPVGAMAVRDDFIYVSGPAIAIQRADADNGEFSYFTCACFGPINGLAADDDNLFIVDAFGTVARIVRETGAVVQAFGREQVGAALTTEDGNVIIGESAGGLTTFDMSAGEPLGSIETPVLVRSILLIPPCPADLSGDRLVNLTDLSRLLSSFGQGGHGDIDGDGQTGLSDLSALLGTFGMACD